MKIIEDYQGRKSKIIDQRAMFVKRTNIISNADTKKNFDQHTNKNIECYRCGCHGHMARECRTKNVSKLKQNSHKAECNGDDEHKTTILVSTTKEVMIAEQRAPVWCIDSGCTVHMCNNKQLIKDFTRVGTDLNLANGKTTKISGSGKVSIMVDTGSEKLILKLLILKSVLRVGSTNQFIISCEKNMIRRRNIERQTS